MKSWMLILLLLSLLIHEAKGIRLITKGTQSDGQNIIFNFFHGRSNDGVEDVTLCKGNHCSGSWLRKLLVSPISSTTTTPKIQNEKKKEKMGTRKENLSIDSSSTTEKRPPTAPETYPGILDIAEMDYSQARRKPPIHN